MQQDVLAELKENKAARQRLAKYMALTCFRNTYVENLHAGKLPHSETGDYSDVRVVTPSGDIPWTKLSRVFDNELMIEVVNRCYDFLDLMTKPEFNRVVEALSKEDVQPDWYNPPHHGIA